MRTKEKIASV